MTETSAFRAVLTELDLGVLDVAFENEPIPETVLIAIGVVVRAHRADAGDEARSLARAELEPPIDRVRRLHSQDDGLLAPGKWCPGCGSVTPCPTIRALNGT